MAKRRSTSKITNTTHFRHDAKRKNIPTAAMEAEGQVPKARRVKYAYSPHLDPILRFDPAGRADKVAAIVDKACRGERLEKSEQEILRAVGENWEQPWLEWTGKQEEHARGHLEVDPVALHIHERISAQAILRNAMREPMEPSLFAVPEQSYAEALQFYQHDVDWANRLILGDSLQVMSSLVLRENLAGRVQTIFIDPPYGIKFRSNFQPEVHTRQVPEDDNGINFQAETVQAYRDTWHLGRHSYSTYLRDRFRVAHDLLADSGSIFVQIGDDNVQLARVLLDEVFGTACFRSQIAFTKGGSGLETAYRLSARLDYLLWYAKDPSKSKFRRLYSRGSIAETSAVWRQDESGFARRVPSDSRADGGRLFVDESLTKPGPGSRYSVEAFGKKFESGKRWWGAPPDAMTRAIRAERVLPVGNTLRRKKFLDESPPRALANLWDGIGGPSDPVYAVQTNEEVIKRCILMTTDPGDLVLDPTCGSGTTAFVAEAWGRRWITIDSSRVALSVARQRVLTGRFDHFRTRGGVSGSLGAENPGSGFCYQTVANVTFSTVSQDTNLDPILDKYAAILSEKLQLANDALAGVPASLQKKLAAKLSAKEKAEGKKSLTEADRRRWALPPQNRGSEEKWTIDPGFEGWYEWEVPFDIDPDWPKPLQDAVLAYRAAWRAKLDAVNRCITDNAKQEQLVDQPEIVRDVIRVSGPFSVEGVIPEELSISDTGVFDSTPNEFEAADQAIAVDPQNLSAYLARMAAHLRTDGLTFLNNKTKRFDHLDAIFEDNSGTLIHAEGVWDGEPESLVAVTFGPQYGSVTALQVEETIRAAKRYTDLVIAGFSFDAETYAIVEGQQHPKLRIHLAQIRPDLNESMDGLLKNKPNSQLFTVFGQPDIHVKQTKEGWVCTLRGVDIYNPTDNTLRSSGADKVSAWFLDSDYDGRCFCATQAFFPNRDAWEKIAKALGDQANIEAFEAFSGTTSLPFEKGKFGRIAVKVIDPRGNEVMAIRTLK